MQITYISAKIIREDVKDKWYKGDYHTMYWGEIVEALKKVRRFRIVTLRLFATRGFAATQAKPSPTSWALGFCLRSAPSALLTTAQRFSEQNAVSRTFFSVPPVRTVFSRENGTKRHSKE